MAKDKWTVGVDMGGTKILVAQVNGEGEVLQHNQISTRVKEGPETVIKDIIGEARKLQEKAGSKPLAIGVGIGRTNPAENRDRQIRSKPRLEKC